MNQGKQETGHGNMKIHAVIAGAGISGIRAAFDLAELGHHVVLIDKAPYAGGILSKLDHQFPDNHCGMCQILPMIDRDKAPQFCLRKGVFHERITFIPQAEILSVDGAAGQLKVRIGKQGTGIDATLCTDCGACEAVCPITVTDDFNEGYSERKAVYLGDPHQMGSMRSIDFNACTRCGACVSACPVGAVNLDQPPVEISYDSVGSVILATGTGQYDPAASDLYGFGVLKNVVTSQGLERIISSSGPYKGQFVRPSDQKPVKSIAWIQCVGSRNLAENADHCSSVCCMFALKEAVLAREKSGGDVRTTIFYMDMRTFGRDFQRYRDDAESRHGVNLVRCRVHSVEPFENTDDLKISYVNKDGQFQEEIVDVVVLSTGRKHNLSHPDFYGKDGVVALSDRFEFKDIAESLIAADVAAGKSLAGSHLPLESVEAKDSLSTERSVTQKALVLGSGPAGLAAALTLAGAGIDVDLVEKDETLGGNGRHITTIPERERFDKLLKSVESHSAIRVHPSTRLMDHKGLPGSFSAKLSSKDGDRQIEKSINYGAVILATGGEKASTTAYGAGQHERIVSVFDLDQRLNENTLDIQDLSDVTMIQCAGSREEPNNYCSRVCCAKALACAIAIMDANPAARIRIFYRDIMTYGESEKLYTQARLKGVIFIPFDLVSKPDVSVAGDTVTVKGFDPVMQETVEFTPSLLVLSTGLVPSHSEDLEEVFRVNVTADGFLKEANSKWRPVDSGREGIFLCGLGRTPMKAGEAMDEGIAAAMRSLRILGRKTLPIPKVRAIVRHSLCSRCEACIPECPYGARYLDFESGRIMVDDASCQACGACASVCPNSSVYIGTFEEPGVMRIIGDFL
jgi:heterodisulfide reductase subunit A-like polyferredoxin